MNLFGNIARAVDGLAEEASKRFQPLAIEAYRHAGRLYQDTREYAAPAAESLWESLDKKGKDAGLDIGAIVEGVLAQANAFADNVPNRAVPAADEAKKYIRVSSEVSTSIQNTDWSSIQDFGIDVGKQVGATADNIWDLMVTGDLLGRLSNEGTMLIQSAQQHLPGAGDRARCWILQHPKEAAALLACIFVPSITLSYTAAVLGLLGFNSEGVAAGMNISLISCDVTDYPNRIFCCHLASLPMWLHHDWQSSCHSSKRWSWWSWTSRCQGDR